MWKTKLPGLVAMDSLESAKETQRHSNFPFK